MSCEILFFCKNVTAPKLYEVGISDYCLVTVTLICNI